MQYTDLDINCASDLQPDGTCLHLLFVYIVIMLHKKYTGKFCSFCDIGKVKHWIRCSLFEITAHENLMTRFIGYTMHPLELASTCMQHTVV